MKYEKAMAMVAEFEAEDIIVTSGPADCGNPSYSQDMGPDYECDGITQYVVKNL